MIKCKFKKVNNWTTTTYAPMGAFDYTTNGVTKYIIQNEIENSDE